jgi:hypothetical protein
MKKKVFLLVLYSLGIFFLVSFVNANSAMKWNSTFNSYEINNCTELQNISLNLSGNYVLMNDIDCLETSAWNWNETLQIYQGFEPLGNCGPQENCYSLMITEEDISFSFRGNFNGRQYKLSNLYINRPYKDNLGLFGVSSGSISNVHLENVTIFGQNRVGSLVGLKFNSLLNSSSKGEVFGNNYVGGLVGTLMSGQPSIPFGKLDKTSFQGNVSGSESTGGLVGTIMGIVNRSFSNSVVSGGSGGGLVGSSDCSFMPGGECFESSCFISDSYSLGTFEALNGGHAGLINHCLGEIENSYSAVYLPATEEVGGLLMQNAYTTIDNSFWDINTSNQTTSGGGIGKTTLEMKNILTYAFWNIVNVSFGEKSEDYVWNIVSGYDYPFLSWQTNPLEEPDNSYLNPNLTQYNSPYTQNFSTFVNLETTPPGWKFNNYSYIGSFGLFSTGGIRGNGTLGFQLTSTNNSFNTSVEILNNIGHTINFLNISYFGKVARIDQTRIPSWTVYLDNQVISALNYSTLAGVDQYKNVLLSGLNIHNGSTFKISWNTSYPSGSGSSRQIGITDISVSALEFIDTIPPIIEIISPINTSYNNATLLVNISTFDNIAISKIWYNWNGTNLSYSSPLNIEFNEGLNILHAWANDSFGNLNYTNISFFIDIAPPIKHESSPSGGGGSKNPQQNFTLNISDNDELANSTFYIFNETGEFNQTFFNLNGENFKVISILLNLLDGFYTWFWEIFDRSGNKLTTLNETILIDTIYPQIEIISPTSGNLDSQEQRVNISVIDTNLDSVWYNWNGTNKSYSSEINIHFNKGNNILFVWANDSLGNTNQTNMSFCVKDFSCVVDTCLGLSCSDGCGGIINGLKICNAGGGYTPKTFSTSIESFSKGYFFEMFFKDKIIFNTMDENHTLTLEKYNSTHARVIIRSEPIIANLEINNTQEFDVNFDGETDVLVRYNGINKLGLASVFIQGVVVEGEEDSTNVDVLGDLDNKKGGFNWLIGILIGVIITGAIIYLAYKKEKRRK